ncbi:MAG: hypothetical protein ACK5C8_03610 [Roseiflexaceae bacterium]|jgi:hypothetical protein|nr:hypothetical protein [Chloroflexaceae bacterium]MCE2853045.1 hypothetical protein [Chloroflexaceae bacterium]
MQLTVQLHLVDEVTIKWIEAESLRTGETIEEVIQKLIHAGITIGTVSTSPSIYHDLDALAGSWSTADAAEFQQNTTDFAQVDHTIWQ